MAGYANHPDRDELDALLARRALEPLSQVESDRLDVLARRFPELDRGAYERAAAAVLLAVTRLDEAMPASLARKLGQLAASGLPQRGADEPDGR